MIINEMLRSEDHQTYLLGAKMLESLPDQEAVALLRGLAESDAELLRVRALKHLGKYDPERTNILALQILRDPNSIFHVSAIYSFWKRGVTLAIPDVIRTLISDPDAIVRTWAAVYLGEWGTASELPVLTLALNDHAADHEGRSVSTIAANAIRQICAREGIDEPDSDRPD